MNTFAITSDGLAGRKPVFGGACLTCPWGVIGGVVRDAMQSYGYDVQICYNCWAVDAPRIVGEARVPPPIKLLPTMTTELVPEPPKGKVDFGATHAQRLWWAYEGMHDYAEDGPRRNLRLIAFIQQPSYLIVAAKRDAVFNDLREIKEKQLAVRLLVDRSKLTEYVLQYYGLDKPSIQKWGGQLLHGGVPHNWKYFDAVIYTGYLGNSPEVTIWYEISQKFDLKFFRLPDDLLDGLAKEFDLQRKSIPFGMLKGMRESIPSVARSGHVVYGRDDTPEDFAYLVAKALDEKQELFQWTMFNFSYNPANVWKAYGTPLHPGAERYYRERGYMR